MHSSSRIILRIIERILQEPHVCRLQSSECRFQIRVADTNGQGIVLPQYLLASRRLQISRREHAATPGPDQLMCVSVVSQICQDMSSGEKKIQA